MTCAVAQIYWLLKIYTSQKDDTYSKNKFAMLANHLVTTVEWLSFLCYFKECGACKIFCGRLVKFTQVSVSPNSHTTVVNKYLALSGFHSWGGGEQGSSRMIVMCESTLTHAYGCVPTRGSGGMPPPPPPPKKIFEFRSSQIASDTI